MENTNIKFSCLDELLFNLEELDFKNSINKKLLYRGFFMKFKNNLHEEIYLYFDTKLFINKIKGLIENGEE